MNLEINYETKIKLTTEEEELSIAEFISKNPITFSYLSSFIFEDTSKNLEAFKNLKIKNYSNDKKEINLVNFSNLSMVLSQIECYKIQANQESNYYDSKTEQMSNLFKELKEELNIDKV
jgi:hypothetical protein